MKTKIRYNHAAYFGNFSVDALEAYLPREIEIEQNEEFEFLEVDLKMGGIGTDERFTGEMFSSKPTSMYFLSYVVFYIEGERIIIELDHTRRMFPNDLVKETLETKSSLVNDKITRILNEQFSNMVDAIKGNQENEIEKQKTEEFIRKNFY